MLKSYWWQVRVQTWTFDSSILYIMSVFYFIFLKLRTISCPGGTVVKNPPAKIGHSGDVGSGRSSEGGNGNLLQYSFLENPWTEEPGGATVHGVTKSWTRLSTHALAATELVILLSFIPGNAKLVLVLRTNHTWLFWISASKFNLKMRLFS